MKTVFILLATVISYSAIGQGISGWPPKGSSGHDHIWVGVHQDTVRSEYVSYASITGISLDTNIKGIEKDTTIYEELFDIMCLICYQKKKKIQATLYKKGAKRYYTTEY